jgi:hypothetical protein
MSLRQKQSKHVLMTAKLIIWAYEQGYELTWGDAYRDPRLHGSVGIKTGYGHSKSCHKIRLAVDLLLFKDGEYLTKTEDYLPLGEYWKSLGGSWGGDFADGNHFSLTHEGMR